MGHFCIELEAEPDGLGEGAAMEGATDRTLQAVSTPWAGC